MKQDTHDKQAVKDDAARALEAYERREKRAAQRYGYDDEEEILIEIVDEQEAEKEPEVPVSTADEQEPIQESEEIIEVVDEPEDEKDTGKTQTIAKTQQLKTSETKTIKAAAVEGSKPAAEVKKEAADSKKTAGAGETVVCQDLPEKILKQTHTAVAHESVVEVSERFAADEKRPVHITEKGRLPLSVSVEMDGGMVLRLAQIGDVLPIKGKRVFSAQSRDVSTVALNIYAGERPLASQNMLISRAKLSKIRPTEKGITVITFEYEIDKNCNITIDVIDEGSLRKRRIEIDKSWLPGEMEIYRMVAGARESLNDDNNLREKNRLLIKAREEILTAQTKLHEKRSGLDSRRKASVKKKVKELKKIIKKVTAANMNELVKSDIVTAVKDLSDELR